jgi:CRP/FNR family transcriptional regulator, cyclic AMP receptor protein
LERLPNNGTEVELSVGRQSEREILTGIAAARDIAMRVGWLSQTPPAFQKGILDRASLQFFSSGETIYMVGAPPGGIYGMISGGVRLAAAAGELGPFMTHYFRPGSWLGEGPIITGGPRIIGLNAAKQTELLHVPLPCLRELLKGEPGFWRWFALLAFEHQRTAVAAVADLMIRDHAKRLVAVLLRLADARTKWPESVGPIEVEASQSDLATMANIARTTANTTLRKLGSAGHVKVTYGRIQVVNPDSLRAMLVE